MYIEPVGRIDRIIRNRRVRYQYDGKDPRRFLETYQKRMRQIEELSQEDKPIKPIISLKSTMNQNSNKYKLSHLRIYRLESKKIRNFRVFNRLNAKSKSDIILDHKTDDNIRMSRMMKAYNKTPQKPIEVDTPSELEKTKKLEKSKKKEQKLDKSHQVETKQEIIKSKTKKEEMKKFKDGMKQKEKTPLDRACDEFDKAQRASIIRARRMKTSGYRGYDKQDYRDYR